MTAALAVFAVTVVLCAGGLVVIAVLCAIRGWQEARRGLDAIEALQEADRG